MFLLRFTEKLREFNAKRGDAINRIPDDKLESAVKLARDETVTPEMIGVLKTLLGWPNDVVFPALDVARLAVMRKEINEELCNEELIQILRRHVNADSVQANQMLTFRLLANMFNQEKGEKLGLEYRDEILKSLLNLSSLGNKNNQVRLNVL